MSRIKNFSFTVLILALLFFSLSVPAKGMGTPPKVPLIHIEGQEAILSSVIVGSGSVFMKIINDGAGDDNLTGVEVNIVGVLTELHDVQNGKMVKAEKIHIPARTTVELKPGSLHLMMFRMPEDLQKGNEFAVHLKFEKSGERVIKVKLAGGVDSHSTHHH